MNDFEFNWPDPNNNNNQNKDLFFKGVFVTLFDKIPPKPFKTFTQKLVKVSYFSLISDVVIVICIKFELICNYFLKYVYFPYNLRICLLR